MNSKRGTDDRVSRVVLMCGPAGAGKSTVARRLEEDGMVRLSFDQEAWSRGIRAMPLAPAVHAEIENARALAHGDDFGLSEELASEYFDHFEPPTPDEGPLTVVQP